jgi:hypothetical protein
MANGVERGINLEQFSSAELLLLLSIALFDDKHGMPLFLSEVMQEKMGVTVADFIHAVGRLSEQKLIAKGRAAFSSGEENTLLLTNSGKLIRDFSRKEILEVIHDREKESEDERKNSQNAE